MQMFNAELQRYHLDALYITNPVNVRYLSGFTGSFGVVFILKNRIVLVTDSRGRVNRSVIFTSCQIKLVRQVPCQING